jgi:hypothetical protein
LRIGWCMPSAQEAIDDTGFAWSFMNDAPAAIVSAVKQSVRRWRLLRVGESLPGLIPVACDVGDPWPTNGTVLCDFSFVLSPLLNGGRAADSDYWCARWKGDLASAISAGQWPQVRKAAVPAWCIEDTRCQLCLADTGTLEHRFECKASLPGDGWPQPPAKAARVLGRLSSQRKRILQTTGLLVLRLPAPPQRGVGTFTWVVQPDESDPSFHDAVWYFDGSLLDGKWKPLRATGFGVAVVARDGQLLGFGQGSPPSWCYTAAAAEAWALQVVVGMCPMPPAMRTDCLSLLRTAEDSISNATAPSKQLARVWQMIITALDGNLQCLAGLLVWMPAHQSLRSVGEMKLSSGQRMSVVDWRANRLVDALAKASAAEVRSLEPARLLIASASEAVKHAAMLLGRVTHAANNHIVTVTAEDGSTSTRRLRDAVEAPRCHKKRKATCLTGAMPTHEATTATIVASGCAALAAAHHAHRERAARRKLASASACTALTIDSHTKRRVEEIGATLRMPSGGASASERIDAIARRVKARFGAG